MPHTEPGAVGREKYGLYTGIFDAYKAGIQWRDKQVKTQVTSLWRWEFKIQKKERNFPLEASRSNRLDGIHTGIMSSHFPWSKFGLSHTLGKGGP